MNKNTLNRWLFSCTYMINISLRQWREIVNIGTHIDKTWEYSGKYEGINADRNEFVFSMFL